MITPSTPDPLAPSLLSQYGFSSNLLANLSGELIITLILIAFTIIIKLSPFLVQHERLRLISSKIKGVWNGYFLAILPRITTFIGWHSRIISLDPINNIMNIIVLSILGIAVLTVFIMLIVEIRGIVASRV